MTEPEDIELEQGDVVALLTAHLAGDEEAIGSMIELVGIYPLFAGTVGFLVELIGPERLQDELDRWRERQLK